ncbi:MAG: hypothetical protein KGS45_01930 [Planctomycetes bacterium]|nr:hypothetical protein [Planctomycetota bacterium]
MTMPATTPVPSRLRTLLLLSGVAASVLAGCLIVSRAAAQSAASAAQTAATQAAATQAAAARAAAQDEEAARKAASSPPAWISTQPATGSWLADAAPTQDWLIGPRPDPDWLTTSSRDFSIASDDDFDHLMALLPKAESRGSIRINGKVILPWDLPSIEAMHESTPDDPR